MPIETAVKSHHASLGFNKVTGALQFTVPHGTKLADALKALATIDLSAVAKLPRGCQPCLSGVPFHIHEEFDPVINVALGH